ncbi:unnamed protein product [Amoebophrya sp. A25]|nr:unnamed protein product [Amoebophrya sp. A25]|eukprot:GSA25T00001717001.1
MIVRDALGSGAPLIRIPSGAVSVQQKKRPPWAGGPRYSYLNNTQPKTKSEERHGQEGAQPRDAEQLPESLKTTTAPIFSTFRSGKNEFIQEHKHKEGGQDQEDVLDLEGFLNDLEAPEAEPMLSDDEQAHHEFGNQRSGPPPPSTMKARKSTPKPVDLWGPPALGNEGGKSLDDSFLADQLSQTAGSYVISNELDSESVESNDDNASVVTDDDDVYRMIVEHPITSSRCSTPPLSQHLSKRSAEDNEAVRNISEKLTHVVRKTQKRYEILLDGTIRFNPADFRNLSTGGCLKSTLTTSESMLARQERDDELERPSPVLEDESSNKGSDYGYGEQEEQIELEDDSDEEKCVGEESDENEQQSDDGEHSCDNDEGGQRNDESDRDATTSNHDDEDDRAYMEDSDYDITEETRREGSHREDTSSDDELHLDF